MNEFTIPYVRTQECGVSFFEEIFPTFDAMRGELLRRGGMLVVDEHVHELYREKIERTFAGLPICAVQAGEKSKSKETLFEILEKMAAVGLERRSILVGLGGGVVCDLAGLAASLYMRGVEYILAPTTLLAQADAAIGGKTAINFYGTKNLIGSFYAPSKVIVGEEFLSTLTKRELRCGLGEIVKCGVLYPPFFETLYEGKEKLFDIKFLKGLVPHVAEYKAETVKNDPFDRLGAREKLNLGHTTAHAIEEKLGLSHGESVLCGLWIESRIARQNFRCDEAFLDRLEKLCEAALEGKKWKEAKGSNFFSAGRDKKNSDGKVCLIVPVAAGETERLTLPLARYQEAVLRALEE